MAQRHARRSPKLFVACIIERSDNCVLIARPDARDGETPESAMRRVVRERLGLHIEIVVGQPPILGVVDGEEAELRFFFCGILDGEASVESYREIRWILKGQLREYDFDAVSQQVVDWLLDG